MRRRSALSKLLRRQSACQKTNAGSCFQNGNSCQRFSCLFYLYLFCILCLRLSSPPAAAPPFDFYFRCSAGHNSAGHIPLTSRAQFSRVRSAARPYTIQPGSFRCSPVYNSAGHIPLLGRTQFSRTRSAARPDTSRYSARPMSFSQREISSSASDVPARRPSVTVADGSSSFMD